MTGLPFARPVKLLVAAQTDPGRERSENQDDFLLADLTVCAEDGGLLARGGEEGAGPGPFKLTLGPRGVLLLVADGMGGGVAGGLASRLACFWIHEELQRAWGSDPGVAPERLAAFLRAAVESANDRLFRQSMESPELRQMGTTATAAVALDDTVFLAQVGDSRAYLVREGEAVQLTRDQSVVQALVDAGTMTEAEAEQSNQRSVILQALGPRPDITVDLTWQRLRRGDTLLLCSDGLSRQLRASELAEVVTIAEDPLAACANLIALANERGGPDNITVVAARLNGDGLEAPTPLDEVGHTPFAPPG